MCDSAADESKVTQRTTNGNYDQRQETGQDSVLHFHCISLVEQDAGRKRQKTKVEMGTEDQSD